MTPPRIALCLPLAALLTASAATAQLTTEDFEMLPVGGGSYIGMGATILDENTVIAAGGPGMVQDGCAYSSTSSGLFQYGVGYLGVPSSCLASSGSGNLRLDYDTPVDYAEFVIFAGAGFPDTVDVYAYDAGGAMIASELAVVLAGPGNPEQIVFSVPGIDAIEVTSNNYHWTPFLDDHVFGTQQTGPALALIGSCGQPGSGATVSNATPGGIVAFAASPNNTGSVANTGPCGAVSIGIGPNVAIVGLYPADALGTVSVMPPNGIPGGACGKYLIGFDVTTCTATNVIQL